MLLFDTIIFSNELLKTVTVLNFKTVTFDLVSADLILLLANRLTFQDLAWPTHVSFVTWCCCETV